MASATFHGVKITGIACAVPTQVDSIFDFQEEFGAEKVEKFIQTTGVKERRSVHDKQTNSDLCFVAAEKLINHKGYEKDSFDGLIYVTQTADYARPATAHILQYRLGLAMDCACMDINLGCSGFVYALETAAALIQTGARKRMLLCCGEGHTVLSPTDDKATSMLFGDVGSATIVESVTDGSSIQTLLKADGEGYKAILTPGINARVKVEFPNIDFERVKETMDGGAVFEFALLRVPKLFKEYFKLYGGSIDDYDACIMHQANLFMLEHIRKKIKLDPEKMPISMDRYGNTSSASIPITIADMLEHKDMGDKVNLITCGFGVGLSWGIAQFSIETKDVLPVISTDDYFEDALV